MKDDTVVKNINRNYNLLISLGYSRQDILKITGLLPRLYSYSEENIQKKISFLESLGYSKQDIIKMTKTFPVLYGLSEENIQNEISFLESLGYSRKDVIKMTKTYPALYSYSEENIQNKISFLEGLGYSRQDVIEMTSDLPALYGYSEENILNKIEYLRKINLEFIIKKDTKYLMQSMALTYARYEYFKNEKGEIINKQTYRKLFCGSKQFKKTYGVNNEELVEKYNYSSLKKYKKLILLPTY